MIDTERDRAICDAATPGPWIQITKGNSVKSQAIFADVNEGASGFFRRNVCCGISPNTENAAFIAHARTALPAYIEEVERLRAELAESKRREQAAVLMMPHNCETCSKECGMCKMMLADKHGGCDDWEMRGPDDRKER